MTTRREAISFGVSSLLPASLSEVADQRLVALVDEHRRFDGAILAAEDEADALLIAGRRSGEERSAAAEAACARAEALHEAQGRRRRRRGSGGQSGAGALGHGMEHGS